MNWVYLLRKMSILSRFNAHLVHTLEHSSSERDSILLPAVPIHTTVFFPIPATLISPDGEKSSSLTNRQRIMIHDAIPLWTVIPSLVGQRVKGYPLFVSPLRDYSIRSTPGVTTVAESNLRKEQTCQKVQVSRLLLLLPTFPNWPPTFVYSRIKRPSFPYQKSCWNVDINN